LPHFAYLDYLSSHHHARLALGSAKSGNVTDCVDVWRQASGRPGSVQTIKTF
jgi:hypothetical protein